MIARAVHRPGRWGSGRRSARRLLSNERLGNLLPERLQQTFGASSTLGYSGNASNSGGTLSVSDGTHMANIALLGSYMASSFVAGSDGHGGMLISEAAQNSTQVPMVTQPHA